MDNDKIDVRLSCDVIGYFSLLQIVFITLKLLNLITWSWLWVLAPIWIPTGVMGVLTLLIGLGIVILDQASQWRVRQWEKQRYKRDR